MFTKGRITAGVLAGLDEFMRSEGLDLNAMAARIGFNPDEEEHKESGFIPFDVFLWLLEAGARESDHDSFALRFAEQHHLEATGLVYYITQNAPNLGEVLRSRERYAQMVASGYSVELKQDGDSATFAWRFPPQLDVHDQFMDYAAAMAVQRIRHLLGGGWMPVKVYLDHPEPRSVADFHRVLGPNIIFGGKLTAIEMTRQDLATPLPHADGDLLRELERGAAALIASPEGQDFLQMVSVEIAKRLPNGVPVIDEVAAMLAMSRRTLQRRLEENDINYRRLVDSVQANMARHLLMETDLPLVEIALLLGFSESSSFSRAARQWLGETPNEFRFRNRIKRA